MRGNGTDVLRDDGHRRRIPEVVAAPGLLVEVAADGFVGQVTGVSPHEVELTDRRGRARRFGLHPGAFLVEDRPVSLVAPPRSKPAAAATLRTTASGSIAVPDAPARVARASRIWVEGIHDAELLERVWGDDLRIEGIVVEPLDGADDLAAAVRTFAPGPRRRLGVLLDHLVPGSKESRIAASVHHAHVAITGHPFVDVWAAVKPQRLGLQAWPEVPKGMPWKQGIVDALGWGDVHDAWRRIRDAVTDYTDLDRCLVGAVEQLLDFLTVPPTEPA